MPPVAGLAGHDDDIGLGQGWSSRGQADYQQTSNVYRDVSGQVGVKLSW